MEESLALLQMLKAPWWAVGEALTYYGWTLHNADQLDQAYENIAKAVEIERDTQQKVEMIEDVALMARVALTCDELNLADACARQILSHLERYGVQGIEHPAMVYLTLYYIFESTNQSERAQAVLTQGQQFVTSQAAQLEDETLRQHYLYNIAENRVLMTLASLSE